MSKEKCRAIQYSFHPVVCIFCLKSHCSVSLNELRAWIYSSGWQSNATPLITQKCGSWSEGIWTAVTKLVEWPVEESVPALSDVLYKGHSYTNTGLSLVSDSLSGGGTCSSVRSSVCIVSVTTFFWKYNVTSMNQILSRNRRTSQQKLYFPAKL